MFFSLVLINACSSATNEVVIFSKGTLNNFDTKLNTEADTPTAANSVDPTKRMYMACCCSHQYNLQ